MLREVYPYYENRRLYIDLDGVMADFEAHFEARTGQPKTVKMPDDILWPLVHAIDDFYRTMPLCPGALEFFQEVKHLNPIFLTSCSKEKYRLHAIQKREWVREFLSTDFHVLPVLGGTNKVLFMHAPGDVLIDDWRKNIEAWEELEGVGIKHEPHDFERTRKLFKEAWMNWPTSWPNAH